VILDAALRLAETGQDVDPIAVLTELTRTGDLRVSGGGPYLHTLLAATVPSWQRHARRVAADFRRRTLGAVALSILGTVNDPGFDPETAFDHARKLIDDATEPSSATGLRSMRQLVTEVLEDIETGTPRGMALPWADLTDALAGLVPGQLIYVGARPAIGKSVIGAQIAAHAGTALGVPVLLASMEMSAEEITMRLISAQSRVSLTSLMHRQVSDGEWDQLAKAAGKVSESKLVIDDTADCSLAHIRSRLRGMARVEKPGLLVVDYLGLMATPVSENRQNAVASLSRGLKLIAREFSIPVVILAQLNRGPESRPDKRPALADLRDSGAQEQDADVVLLLHREDAYDRESPRAGEMDVIVAKNRQGPQCTVTLAFQGHYGRAVDMAWSPSHGATS
jgi:replicative DNA helicase